MTELQKQIISNYKQFDKALDWMNGCKDDTERAEKMSSFKKLESIINRSFERLTDKQKNEVALALVDLGILDERFRVVIEMFNGTVTSLIKDQI